MRFAGFFSSVVLPGLASLIIGSSALAAPPCLGPQSNVWITVTVDGVRNADGQVTTTIYPDDPARFLVKHGSLYVVRTPAVAGATTYCVFLPQTGVFAIAVYHDEDNSGTINSVRGVPTEGFGFSNNPQTFASLPTFRSVRIAVPRNNLATRIHLNYYGAKGNVAYTNQSGAVHLVNEQGVFKVPVTINDSIKLSFIVDSGASDVSIPVDVVSVMFRSGTLTSSDFIGSQTYVIADGSKVPSERFIIRNLKVGDFIIQNVVGSVANVQGDLLLGQSFLQKFKQWSINNADHTLVLER